MRNYYQRHPFPEKLRIFTFKKFLLVLLFVFVADFFAFAQQDTTKQKSWHENVIGVSGFYSLQSPFGELTDRYGLNSDVGIHPFFMLRNNFTFGLEFNYMFGNQLKADAAHILDGLRIDNGEILNTNGEYANIVLSERGFFAGGRIGKIFYLKKGKKIAMVTNFGIGLLQHKIRIEVEGNNVPGLYGDYAKGYDRLTNGLSINQFLGVGYMPLYSPINFFVGIEVNEAWTKNRRDFNFDTMEQDTHLRHDYLLGIKAGWIITIYKQNIKQYYYF